MYFAHEQRVQHQWVALTNPESDKYDEITGMIKLSCAVMGPGGEQRKLEDQVGPDPPDSQLIMGPNVKRTYSQLKVRFFEGRNLFEPKRFALVKSLDPVITCTYQGGAKMKTESVEYDGTACAFDQEFWIPVSTP